MKHLRRETLHLAATYLIIIMVMSLGFSIVLYNVSVRELNRRPPFVETTIIQSQQPHDQMIQQYLDRRIDESRTALLVDLVVVNLLTLIIGALVSYLLAERTLRPIEENMEAQMQFVSDASHELRTPLTALRTANEVALRQKNLTADAARQVIAENVDDIARLQTLTNSMLGLLSDGPSEETWQVLPLREVVDTSVKLVAVQAKAKKITIATKITDVKVRANEAQLIQLMTILLDNAVKYSNARGKVTVSAARQGKTVEVSITDTGVGMSEEVLRNVFTRFYRAEQSRTTPGYGLGLAIAEKIVASHKGKIRVKSRPSKGSTFTFTLPTVARTAKSSGS